MDLFSSQNRARDLRSKIKDIHDRDDSSVTRMSSREIQRQRRSRQLEETQRLLDQFSDTKLVEDPTTRVSSSNHSARFEKVPSYGDARGSTDASSFSSSQELLCRSSHSQSREKYSAGSSMEYYKNSTSSQANARQIESSSLSRTVRESDRQPNQFGRGRGRGRSSTSGARSSSQHQVLGSSSSSMRSAVSTSSVRSSKQQGHIQHSNFSTANESVALPKPQCFYLKEHRLPEYKDGECEKLAVLRQRLAARRRVRELALDEETNEQRNTPPVPVHHGTPNPVSHPVSREDRREHFDKQRRIEYVDDEEHLNESNASYRSITDNIDHSRINRLNVSAGSENDRSIASEQSVVEIELIPCDSCGRKFAPKIYEKHFDSNGQPKCLNTKKRTVFNSAKNRISNNANLNSSEQEQVLRMNKKVAKELARKKKSGRSSSSTEKIRRNSKWREESAQFREAMKACKM